MRCQDFKRLMLDAGDRLLSREELLAVEDHLAQCADCSAFQEFWENIRADLGNAPQSEVPASLENQVRSLCHDEIRAGRKQLAPSRDTSVPWLIWAAFASLTALTIALLIGGIEEFSRSGELTAEAIALLMLILQNGLTLFFAPVIMRRRRLADMDSGSIK